MITLCKQIRDKKKTLLHCHLEDCTGPCASVFADKRTWAGPGDQLGCVQSQQVMLIVASAIVTLQPSSHVPFVAALSQLLWQLLQQSSSRQSSAGPQETRPPSPGFPAAMFRIPLQPQTRSVEFPRYSKEPPGKIPSAPSRDPEAHTKR